MITPRKLAGLGPRGEPRAACSSLDLADVQVVARPASERAAGLELVEVEAGVELQELLVGA